MVAIDQFLEELCPLNEKSVFQTFFLSAYRYSFDIWYIALVRHLFEFGFDPLQFHEVMAHGLTKILQIVRYFFYCCCFPFPLPLLALQSWIVTNQNLVLLICLNYFD
jgi:hypothetical protein